MSDWKAYTVIGTNVVIDCGTVEEAIAYERELWANQPYAPATPAPLDVALPPGDPTLMSGYKPAKRTAATSVTPAPLDGRRTAAAATFAEALHRDVPWFVGGSQDAENAMIDAIEAEARATPAPLDVLVAARDVDLSWFVADLGDGTVKMRYASDLPRVLNALREALAANKDAAPAPLDVDCGDPFHKTAECPTCGLPDTGFDRGYRDALATPAPLDVALCDCGHGYPSYGIGKRKHLPSCHYGIIADWLDQPAPTPLAPHPGENHEYDMTCRRCGEPGYLFVGFHSPGETFRWSEAQPKEAE